MIDTTGLIINTVSEQAPNWAPILIPVLTAIGGALFRITQKYLQGLPTRWRWVNNRLTVGIISKIIQALFGKTTLLYNAIPSDLKSKQELKKEVEKYLSSKGGILEEFNKAIKN